MNEIRRLLPSILAVLAVLAVLMGAAAAHGLTFVKAPDEDLVDQADVIVRAVARPLESEPPADGLPTTRYSLEVKTALRGATPGELLEIEVPGGRNAAGLVAHVFGAPSFAAGEEALFFLERGDRGLLRIVHLNQGVFRLAELRGGRVAWRAFEQGSEIVLPGQDPEQERPRHLALFEAWVAARLAGRHLPADYRLAGDAQGELEAATSSFTIYFDRDGRPVRWPKSTGRLDLTFFADEVPQPGLQEGGYPQVEASLAAWTDLPDGHLRLRYGGLTGNTTGFHREDGVNSIVFDNHAQANNYHQPFNCAAGTGVLGNGLAWTAGTHTYGGQVFQTVVSGDVVINEDVDCWSRFTPLNFELIVAHEIGHILALGHSCGDDESGPCDTPEKDQAIMLAGHRGDNRGARLSEDDRRGIAFLYGPPAAPTSLDAEVDSGNRVDLSWGDGSDNESGFAIYRERSGGNLIRIGSTGSGVRRFEDADTAPSTTYRYLVRAENENGQSSGAETTITTAFLDTPAQLAATAAGPDRIALTWVDQAGNESGYEVWGRFLGGDELLATLPANSQAATVESLIADSTYTFKVRATGLPSGSTAFSNTASATTLPAPIGPCVDGAAATCLAAERFEVEVRWKDFAGQRGEALVAPAGSADSGIFYFFSPSNWEMLVKVLDGCAINGKHWVFAAGTTNVETTLIVTDSLTGKTAVYFNPLGTAAPAITDTEAFEGCSETAVAAKKEAAATALAAGCDGAPGDLCLLGGRYEVAVTWTDFAGVTGSGQAVPAGTADSGLFYFFSPDNWEMLVKVLDGCAINHKIWVFAAATTNVAYTLTVKDTATGLARTYANPLGQSSPAITDIEAFAACSEPDGGSSASAGIF